MSTNENPADEVEYYTEEEVVEEEVEEEVEEAQTRVEGSVGNQSSVVQVQTEDVKSVSVKSSVPPSKPRGKVVPSPAVANMKMRQPAQKPSPPGNSLTPSKNPFTTFGNWDAKTISEIQIRFPDLSNKCESTNDLTRGNRPEARYWKSPITFKYETYSSETIRFNNVQIPYMPGVRNYGSSFVYICLPGDVGSAFTRAGKLKRPTIIGEAKLVPDPKRWWKAVNGIEGSFGQIDSVTRSFVAKPLDAIFEATSKGVIANLVLRFLCKANTDNKEPLKPTTVSTVAVELIRGYIVSVDADIEPPVRITREKKKAEPLAVSSDVATDDLSKRLAELGI